MEFLQKALRGFTAYLRAVGYGAGSVYMLPHCVKEFLLFIGARHNGGSIGAIRAVDVLAFYEQLQVRPLQRRQGALSGQMINHYGYSLRVFFDWLQVTGQQPVNPVSGLRWPRLAAGERTPLSVSEIAALFDQAHTLRERVILHLFYSCGLRRSEGEALNLGDVDTGQGLLYVRSGKGARRRVVPLAGSVAACLAGYLDAERQERATGNDSFMANRYGARMRGESYNGVVHTLGLRAGLAEPVTPHRLRHSIATHLLNRGMAMEQVRDFLGHRHLETTQLYAKLLPEKLLRL